MPRVEVVLKDMTISNVTEVSCSADRAFDLGTRKCGAEPNIDYVQISRNLAEPVKDANVLWEQMKKKEELFTMTVKFFELDKDANDHFRMITFDGVRIISCSMAGSAQGTAINETATLAVDKVTISSPDTKDVEISVPKKS